MPRARSSRSELPATILVLVDGEVLVPNSTRFAAHQLDRLVVQSLNRQVRHCSVAAFVELRQLLRVIDDVKPDLVFNLTQHAQGDRRKDVHICAVLEMQGVPYTGSGIRGLVLGRDKAVSKRIAAESGFEIPQFFVVAADSISVPTNTTFPVVVKPRYGDSSEGISQESVVHTTRALIERVRLLRRAGCQDIICEQFVEGREMAVGLLCGDIVSPREFLIGRLERGTPLVASDRFKYDAAYRRRWKIRTDYPKLDKRLLSTLRECAVQTAASLELLDYARLDIKLTPQQSWVFLEANPNPGLSKSGTTWSGTWDSVDFDQMIAKIVSEAFARQSTRI